MFHNVPRANKNKQIIYSLTNIEEFDLRKKNVFQNKKVRTSRKKNIQHDTITKKKEV